MTFVSDLTHSVWSHLEVSCASMSSNFSVSSSTFSVVTWRWSWTSSSCFLRSFRRGRTLHPTLQDTGSYSHLAFTLQRGILSLHPSFGHGTSTFGQVSRWVVVLSWCSPFPGNVDTCTDVLGSRLWDAPFSETYIAISLSILHSVRISIYLFITPWATVQITWSLWSK